MPRGKAHDKKPELYYIATCLFLSVITTGLMIISIWYFQIFRRIGRTIKTVQRTQKSVHAQTPGHPATEKLEKAVVLISTDPSQVNSTPKHQCDTATAIKEDEKKKEEAVFRKIIFLAGSTVLVWSPFALTMVLSVICGITTPPVIDGIAVLIQTFSPIVNGILILKLMEHYNKWARQFFDHLRQRLKN